MESHQKRVIIDSLKSNEKQLIIIALDDAEEFMDDEVIDAIIQLYLRSNDEDIQRECITNLVLVKANSVGHFYINGCKQCSDDKLKNLLACCWQTGIDFKSDLLFFVSIAIQNNFEIAFEAITVIENFEPPYDIIILNEAINQVTVSISKQPDDKLNLMESLNVTLKNFKLSNYIEPFNNN